MDFGVAGQLSLHLRQLALQAVLDTHNVYVVFFVTHTNGFTVLTINTEVAGLVDGHPPRSSLALGDDIHLHALVKEGSREICSAGAVGASQVKLEVPTPGGTTSPPMCLTLRELGPTSPWMNLDLSAV